MHYLSSFYLGVDGKTNFLLSPVAMPRKNNIVIARDFFIPILRRYGLFDCLLTDHGREFVLIQFIQEKLADLRTTNGHLSERPPTRKITSPAVSPQL